MDISELKKTALFENFTEEEILSARQLLKNQVKVYQKSDLIMRAGTLTDSIGLVLSGSVTIESDDFWGNRTVLSKIEEGGFFGEAYAVLPNEPLLVNVTADESSRVLFINIAEIVSSKLNTQLWINKFTVNLLKISARKNLTLSEKNFYTAPKTIRERVMLYLNICSVKAKSSDFEIPFNRRRLADFLNVERTALSKELSKMQKDGLIKYRKNRFEITPDM